MSTQTHGGTTEEGTHGGTTEEGNCSYLLPLSHRETESRARKHTLCFVPVCARPPLPPRQQTLFDKITSEQLFISPSFLAELTCRLPYLIVIGFAHRISNLLCCSHDCPGKIHIDWTICLMCGHQFWFGPWPWPWIFEVKYWIVYIKNGYCCYCVMSGWRHGAVKKVAI